VAPFSRTESSPTLSSRQDKSQRVDVGQSDSVIEWVVVRPDTLINEDHAAEYRDAEYETMAT
jgi:hypothetical protein